MSFCDETLVTVSSALASCQVRTERKFELQELTDIFLGKHLGFVFWFVAITNSLLNSWLQAQVAAASWASNLPFKGSVFAKCTDEDFLLHDHPNGGCWNSYAVCIVVFGVITVFLAWFDLHQLGFLNYIVTVARFIVLAAMVVHSLVLSADRNVDRKEPKETGNSVWTNFSTAGWLASVPVFIFSQLFPLPIPTVIQPMSNKAKLRRMLIAAVTTNAVLYFVVGVAVATNFEWNTNEMANLNWVRYTGEKYNGAVRALAHIIVLFPSVDVTLSFVYQAIVLVNIAESWIFGGHVSFSRQTRFIHRLIASIIPLIGAVFITNLVTVTKYISLTVYFLGVVIPAAIQYKSKNIWLKKLCSLSQQKEMPDDRSKGATFINRAALIATDLCPTSLNDNPYSGWYSRTPVVIVVLVSAVICAIITVVGMVSYPVQ